jgi:D-3-phosphoglycerate dehydrogenase
VVSGQVSYVNAPVLAAERNIQSRLLTDPDSPQYQNVVTVRGTLPEGTQLAVSGTVTGPKRIEKLVGIDGYDLEVALAAHMLVLRYTDRPGVIGTVGRLLGDSGTNIASMQVGRTDAGGAAVSVLTLDEGPGQAVLDEIAAEIGAESVRLITLD